MDEEPVTRSRFTFISIAHHEAAHAVAHAVLRIAGDVTGVSIDPEEVPDQDALGVSWHREPLSPVCGNAIDHAAIRARVVCLLAGPLAEERWTGREKSGCGDDVERAFELLASAYLDTAETLGHAALRESDPETAGREEGGRAIKGVRGRFVECMGEAEALVGERWEVIGAVARRLARRKRLSGDEVRTIVEASR